MPKLIVIDREGAKRVLDGSTGLSVMEAIRGNGIDELMAICGGCLSCATCHVYVDPAFAASLPAIGEEETNLLDGSAFFKETSRLSCQILMTDALDGLTVEIAPED